MSKILPFPSRRPTAPGASPPPRVPNRRRRSREHLTPAEVERLMDAAGSVGRHGRRDRALILLAYRHGLRVSELVNLGWVSVGMQKSPLVGIELSPPIF